MEIDGGGWTVFQNRFDGSVKFGKNFSMYENGFGDINGEFWLGLKNIQELTTMPSEVRYDFQIYPEKLNVSATYRSFKLLGTTYTLAIDEEDQQTTYYFGNTNAYIDFSLTTFKGANGANFTVFDRDSINACASVWGGGWWYTISGCQEMIHLNNDLRKNNVTNSTVHSSRMMFRRT